MNDKVDSHVQHTPGPWRADWDDNGCWYIEPLGVTGAKLRGDSGECIEAANARLIAAAPDLYEAAKRLIEGAEAEGWDRARGTDEPRTGIAELRAAIAKAEGQS